MTSSSRPFPAHPPRAPALGLALMCLATLCAADTRSHKARAPKAASSPSTAQILAPSAATVPDALPPDKLVYRCGDSYSAQRCAGAAALDVADARTDAQRRQSAELTARDKRLAAWYEAGRREREAPASSAAPVRRTIAPATCADTATMHCVPKTPRTRIVSSSGAPSPPLVAKGKN